jgi:hypothetical protein
MIESSSIAQIGIRRLAGRRTAADSHIGGRERFWREMGLYLEFWAIAREPLAVSQTRPPCPNEHLSRPRRGLR